MRSAAVRIGLVCLGYPAQGGQVVGPIPHSRCEACQVGSAHGGGLGHLGGVDRYAEEVGECLHHERVDGDATVDTQGRERPAGIDDHDIGDIREL